MTPNERAKAALRYQNRKNRAQGAFFEQMINGACDFYRSRQIADIEKTPEPMQPTKDLGGGKFIAHYTSTAQADYKGFLFGGRAVNFEAKYTDVEKMTQDRVTAVRRSAWSGRINSEPWPLSCVPLGPWDFTASPGQSGGT